MASIRMPKPWRLPRFVRNHGRAPSSRCFWKLSKAAFGQLRAVDPTHYYTSPGLTLDALLEKTDVELELLTNLDMHLFIERGMRGSISMVSKCYAKTNNPQVEGYDSSKPTNYITYYDTNNGYGWAMSLPLPKSDFKWKRVVPSEEQIMKNEEGAHTRSRFGIPGRRKKK